MSLCMQGGMGCLKPASTMNTGAGNAVINEWAGLGVVA